MECKNAFKELNKNTDRTLSRAWAKQAKNAAAKRVADPKAMLIYDVQHEKGVGPSHCGACGEIN